MSPLLLVVLALLAGSLWAAALADRPRADRYVWASLGFLLGPLALCARMPHRRGPPRG